MLHLRWKKQIAAAVILTGVALSLACGGEASGNGDTPTSTPRARASATTPAGSPTPEAASPTAEAAAPTATPPAAVPQPTATQASAPPPPDPTSPPPPPPPAPEPTSPPPPPPPPATQSLTIAAVNVAFVPATSSLAAGVPATITFDNRDAGVQHDLVIYGPGGDQVAQTALTTGPATASTSFTPAPGNYALRCTVHPRIMSGTIVVQ